MSDLKKCRACAEEIKAEAVKCKHCGEEQATLAAGSSKGAAGLGGAMLAGGVMVIGGGMVGYPDPEYSGLMGSVGGGMFLVGIVSMIAAFAIASSELPPSETAAPSPATETSLSTTRLVLFAGLALALLMAVASVL
jgi:hypothetical protein